MLNAIVRFSLRHRGIVIALAFALLGYGAYSLTRAKYDVFPEFSPPTVVVQTEAPGLSPEQVELLVTTPIEVAINGVPGIESLRSSSIQGVSIVTATFQIATDVYRARQVVTERLTTLEGRLPSSVQPPVMEPLTSTTGNILYVGLTSSTLSLMQLRTIADWTVRLRLLSVPGVANVTVFGGDVKQYQIQPIPERLIQFDLGMNEVFNAAQNATGIRGAGFIDSANQRLILQSQGQALTPAELASTVVAQSNGVNVTLGQVANVSEAPAPPFGAATIDGQPGVGLMVLDQYGANTLEVTQAVEQELESLRPTLNHQGVQTHTKLFRPANFIETALSNIRSSLLIGAVLVIVVLFLFLFNFRTAAISCTAIPLSLLVAVTVMEQMGFTLNTMTLGGLAIAIGEVVDDAVIDVENVLRRLRENRTLPNPRPAIRVVLDASMEVRSAVVYASFAVVLVFVPILTMSGLAGRIFAPLGIAYILSILASLGVALTVTPALSLVFLAKGEFKEEDPPVVRWLKKRYRSVLLGVERAPRLVIVMVAVVTLVGAIALPFFSASFLPELREGHFILHMTAVPGTSLAESLRIGNRVTQALLKVPVVRSVAQRAGRAELSEDTFGPNASEFEVDLKPGLSGKQNEQAQIELFKVLAPFAGVNFALNTFLTERIEETLSGYTAAVVVNIYGNDLDQLDSLAQQVSQILPGVPGATGVQMQSPPGTPQVAIELRPADVARWGFDPVSVLDVIRAAFGGTTVGQVYEGNRVFDVAVILPLQDRQNIAEIKALPLRSPSGNYVSLSQLATVYEASGRYIILHDGAQRVQTITCNVSGVSADAFVQNARKLIESRISFPAGTYMDFAGTAAAQAQSRHDLMVHSGLAGLGIILLLSVIMMNYRNLLLVLVNIPFALVGGVFAVWAMGGMLSLGPLVGFITLFGITLRNSIMLISHYEHLVAVEGMEWGLEAAMRGASERLAPILMTATVTGLGLLPLAIGSGAPGREIEGPMAIVIVGGLVSSTALNLLVLPSFALRYGRFGKIDQEL
ncbi:MAG: efflux RND transporter permease subunit [Candidatus Acidiferrales bacterium]